MSRSKRYAYYLRALEGDFTGWDADDAPFPGFWRFRFHRRDIWRPCATWDAKRRRGKPLEVHCVIGRTGPAGGFIMVSHSALWAWSDMSIWQRPVTEAQYRHAVVHGDWHDSLKAKPAQGRARVVASLRDAAPIGPPKREKASRGK